MARRCKLPLLLITRSSTLFPLNRTALNPGDSVFFKRGGIWHGSLSPPTSAATFSRDTSDFFPPTLPSANQASIKVTVNADTSGVNDMQLYAMVGQIDGGQCHKPFFNASREPDEELKTHKNVGAHPHAGRLNPSVPIRRRLARIVTEISKVLLIACHVINISSF